MNKVREGTMTYLCHLEDENAIILDSKTGTILTMPSSDKYEWIGIDFNYWLNQQLKRFQEVTERAKKTKQEQATLLALEADKLREAVLMDDGTDSSKEEQDDHPLTQRRMFEPKQLHHQEELEQRVKG